MRRLNGGCDVPIASYAIIDGDQLWLRARVGSPDGSQLLEAEGRGADPDALGFAVADQLLADGAEAILSAVRG